MKFLEMKPTLLLAALLSLPSTVPAENNSSGKKLDFEKKEDGSSNGKRRFSLPGASGRSGFNSLSPRFSESDFEADLHSSQPFLPQQNRYTQDPSKQKDTKNWIFNTAEDVEKTPEEAFGVKEYNDDKGDKGSSKSPMQRFLVGDNRNTKDEEAEQKEQSAKQQAANSESEENKRPPIQSDFSIRNDQGISSTGVQNGKSDLNAPGGSAVSPPPGGINAPAVLPPGSLGSDSSRNDRVGQVGKLFETPATRKLQGSFDSAGSPGRLDFGERGSFVGGLMSPPSDTALSRSIPSGIPSGAGSFESRVPGPSVDFGGVTGGASLPNYSGGGLPSSGGASSEVWVKPQPAQLPAPKRIF